MPKRRKKGATLPRARARAATEDAPACPRCGCLMTGGAPHGPWPVQWECRHCGTIVVPPTPSH